jgi:hypothetical protein
MTIPSVESGEAGRITYEAFAAALGWKFRGAQLPPWNRLEPYERDAFREAGHQAIQKGWVQAQDSSTIKRKRHL